MVLLAAGVAAARPAGTADEDGRYHLELRGAAAIFAPAPPGRSRAPAPRGDGDDDSPGAPDEASLVVLERSGGQWAASLCGQFGLGRTLARGIVHTAERRGQSWHLAAHLLLGGLPRKRDWLTKDPPAICELELTFQARDGKLSGTWKAAAGDRSARGELAGHVEPLRIWALPPAAPPGEHPRFLLRKADLPTLKAKARTPWGQAMLKRLAEPGWSRSGMAVGQGLLWQLTGEKSHADKARELIDADIRSGWWKAIGPIHDPAHKAAAAMIAWDLIHDTCDAAYNARMRQFLGDKMRFLWDYAEINSGNGHPHSNWSGQYRAAVAMVALALLADPAPALPDPPGEWDFPKVAPPAAFKVAPGMPVLPVGDAPLRKWLYSGPLNIGLEHDGLAALGGAAGAWPAAGTTFTVKVKADERRDDVSGRFPQAILFKNTRPRPQNRDVQGDDLQPLTKEMTVTFAPVPDSVVIAANEYIERGIGGPGMVSAWRAAGCRSFQTVYYFAVLDNPAPRRVQVRLTGSKGDWYYHNSGLYISGRWFQHGDVLLLQKGKHPVLRQMTVGQLCDAHGRHHLYDEVWLVPLDDAAVRRARDIRHTEASFRRRCLVALKPRYDQIGRPDVDALLWLPLARRFMDLYCRNAISERGWHCAGQCYTQHPMLVAMPFAHAWRNATGTDVCGEQHLGWYLVQAAMRTVFADRWARMQDYGRGGGPVGADLFSRGFASVPPDIRPAVLWAWRRTADLTDRKLFSAPEGAVEKLDPMSAALAFVNWPAEAAGKANEQNPSAVLPRAMVDADRLGYTMRNRWQDGNDIVTVFTGFRHPGGDWPCEGAAIDLRMMGLGAEWLVRGNGGPTDPTNTVAVEGAGAPADVTRTHLAVAPDGSATVSLSYRLGKDGRGLRCVGVDYSGASGAAALLAIVDRIDFEPPAAAAGKGKGRPVKPPKSPAPRPSAEPPGGGPDELLGPPAAATPADQGPNLWRLVTHLDNKAAVREGGFRVTAANGAALDGLVAWPPKARCAVEEASHKIEINYRADHLGGQFTRRVVSFPGREFFFVVMALGAGRPPPIAVAGAGPQATVRIARQTVRFDGEKIVFSAFNAAANAR